MFEYMKTSPLYSKAEFIKDLFYYGCVYIFYCIVLAGLIAFLYNRNVIRNKKVATGCLAFATIILPMAYILLRGYYI